MHPVSSTNTHNDVTDLVNHGMVKNTKAWISWDRKKLLPCVSDYTFWEIIILYQSLRNWQRRNVCRNLTQTGNLETKVLWTIDKSKIYDEVTKNRTWKDWGWELQLPQVLIKLATNGFFWARHQNLTANRSMLKDLIVCFFNNLHLHFEYDYINLGKSDFFVIFQESPN